MLARLCGHHGNLCEVSPMGALTLIGAAVGAVGAIAAGRAQANAAAFNADMAQQQAERERQIAARDADDYRRSNSRLLATSRARRAGSGVTSQRSPRLGDETTAAEIERGAQDLPAGGEIGRAACRGRGWQCVWITGVAAPIK